jgi:GAF domain-containing protein
MLKDKQANDVPKTQTWWNSLGQFLFEAHSEILEGGARRQARLISILALLITLTNIVGASVVFFTSQSFKAGFTLVGLTVFSIIGYALSRTRFYKTGGYTIVWSLALAAFWGGSSNNLSLSLYSNLIPALVIASIIFPFRYMTFFVGLNNLLILALGLQPFIYPEYNNFLIDLAVFIPFGLLVLTAMRYRDNVEHDRLAEFKRINQELIDLSNELEQRVEIRTQALQERSRQMQAVTEVARTAASFQDLDRLLTSSTRLISESFGFYHVGIFLLDEEGQYVILRSANSEGGQRMLVRAHTLPVDLNSVVGYTAKTQSPRIALDTGTDAVHFKNPDLPETRSEMAVPLKVGMHLIGVLDVQSTEKDAFSDEDIAIISTLGDQLAVAMENTRLLLETRRALVSAEQTYQRYFNQTWAQYAHRLKQPGYRYQDGQVLPLSELFEQNQTETGSDSKLSIPLMVRGQNIGVLEVQSSNKQQSWTAGELSILEAAAERAAFALESARLLEDAQRRAAKEQAIGEATSRINSAINLDNILQTALREMGRILPGAEISIQVENN